MSVGESGVLMRPSFRPTAGSGFPVKLDTLTQKPLF